MAINTYPYVTVGPFRLTKKQAKIYRFIAFFFARNLRTPTYREIGDEVGIVSPNAVVGHLRLLAKKGVIRINSEALGTRYVSRGIELVGVEAAVRKAVAEQVAKVLGHHREGGT